MTGAGGITQKITPLLIFVGKVFGKTEEAMGSYASVFKDSPGAGSTGPARADILSRYGKGEEPDKEGPVEFASFKLLGQEFAAMDSAWEHGFAFNEAISLNEPCDTQEEIDYFWGKLSADPKPSNAAGSKTSMDSHGKSLPRFWVR